MTGRRSPASLALVATDGTAQPPTAVAGLIEAFDPGEPPCRPLPPSAPHPPSDAVYLQTLGRRVRDERTRRGITRKVLARLSEVSERYLAQLEAGRGNISIVLLRQVARAMDIPVHDLVREETPEPAPRRERVALVGLPGAGKAALGRRLAERLGLPLVVLDDEVARDVGMSAAEFVSLCGADAFARAEHRCLRAVSERLARVVLVVGGTAPHEVAMLPFLQAAYTTVWVRTPVERCVDRVRDAAGGAQNGLRRTLGERAAQYGAADLAVDLASRPAATCEDEAVRTVLATLAAPSRPAPARPAPARPAPAR